MKSKLEICFSVRGYGDGKEFFISEQEILNDLDRVKELVKSGVIWLDAPYASLNIQLFRKEILGESYFDDLEHVLSHIFYHNLNRLKKGEEVTVSMPRTGTFIILKSDHNSRLVFRLKRNNKLGNFNIQHTLPEQDFIFEIVQVYWRYIRIFALMGLGFTQIWEITDDNIHDLDTILVPNYWILLSNWKRYTPSNILTNRQMDMLEGFMNMPIKEWVAMREC